MLQWGFLFLYGFVVELVDTSVLETGPARGGGSSPSKPTIPSWRNGRRGRLKICCPERTCKFESYWRYMESKLVRVLNLFAKQCVPSGMCFEYTALRIRKVKLLVEQS